MPRQSKVTRAVRGAFSKVNALPVSRASSSKTSRAGFFSTFKVTRVGSVTLIDSRRSTRTSSRRIASGSTDFANAAFKSGTAW